jgi:M6 family metalloprotease-like protein
MKTKIFSISLLILFLISACGSATQPPAPTLTSAPPALTVEPVTPTIAVTSTPAPTATATLPPVPSTQVECKLNVYEFPFTAVGFGFPKADTTLPSLGTVKTVVLFVDFEDAPATQTPEEVFSIISPNAEKFFYDVSYGKMNYVLVPYFKWLRLDRPSSYYHYASYELIDDYYQDALNLADENVDFSAADSVVLMVPPDASTLPYGPAYLSFDGSSYSADGKEFFVGARSGADLTNWGYPWLNHEIGHNMGLPDLYVFQSNRAFRYIGGFSLMGNIAGFAPEYFAYERWQLGWIDDNQIFCQLDGEQVTTLTAIEIPGGIKAVIVPVGSSRVVVIESRKKLGYDVNLIEEGVLVYVVDSAIQTLKGPLTVYPDLETDPNREQAPLAVGESITVAGVTITVLESTSETDTVQVIVNQ